MNEEQKSEPVPRWTWIVVLFLVIIGFLMIISDALPESSLGGASQSTKTNSDKCYFSSGQDRMVITLEPNEWSCQIITPAGHTYRIDTDHNAKVCFMDGECLEVGPTIKDEWVVKRGIFQLMSSSQGTKATITIE